MTISKKSGKTLALTAAALLLSGTALHPTTAHAQANTAKVKCLGVNSCKGTGSCKTAANDCSGHNACKGQGWIELTAADCTAKGGTVVSG